MTDAVRLDRVSKSFHSRRLTVEAIRDVSFTVSHREFVTIIGPSGSGKSTLLNLLAGLLKPDSGTISLQGREMRKGAVAYMPQKDLLLPWRRVIDNVTLPLEAGGMPRKRARTQVASALEEFGLEEFSLAFPSELSGGMAQRAALLRTVASGAPVLLLDEPFGALDAITRRQMQDWLLSIHRRLERTIVFITHDVDEAVYLADRVLVLSERPGRLVRELTVELDRPRNQAMTGHEVFARMVGTLIDDLGLSCHET